MKHFFSFTLLCAMLTIATPIKAQLPKTSTAKAPAWYYIQVKGEGADRVGRILTVINNHVYGDFLTNIKSEEDRNIRLWRFEKEGNAVSIINKATNKKIGIRIASEIESNLKVATLAEDDSQAETWEMIEHNGGYQLKSSSGQYAHQANNHAGRQYITILTGTEWAYSDNSIYNFVAYSNTLPSISSSKNEYWYHIISGKQEYKHKCITDVTTTSNNSIKFEVKDIAPENDNQLWKVILPINTASGTFLFVNKLTGNIIQTHYEEYNGNYCVQATTSQAATNKWKIKHLDFDQFIISGINSQGYEGYLNVSPSTKPAHFPASTDLLGSAYAWIFEKVETNGSAIEDVTTADPFEHISIHTANGRIIVEGTNQYTITGLSGMVCEKEQQLSPGVYLITIQGKSVAYLVK